MLTKPLARYSHSRVVSPLLFIAGQGSRDPETDTYLGVTRDGSGRVIGHDANRQTRGVLDNIERVLKGHGLTRAALVDVQVFLTSMEDFPAMNEAWNQFFAEVPEPPTRTTVAVVQLPGDNFVEMKSVATFSPTHNT